MSHPGSSPWLAAIRPKTLALSVSPVLLGSALAFAERSSFDTWVFLACLLAAMLIQIGTNLHNDAQDFLRGADGDDRLGPPRAVAKGWLSAVQVQRAALMCFAGAFALGIYLVMVGGWPILILGLASLAAGYGYSGGRYPISHSPFGELFVILFFGLGAVLGTYYLQAHELSLSAWLLALMLGMQAAAVLTINNFRDRVQDAQAGRRTLSVITPPAFSRMLYALLMLSPFVLVLVVENLNRSGHWLLLSSWLVLPWALWLVRKLALNREPRLLNPVLAHTAQLQIVFSALLIAGILL